MVDMNMLLITFFMLCTTMIKSQTLTIALQTNEKIENKENLNQASADDAVTIILDAKRKANSSEVDTVNGKVVPVVYYYEGKPGGDGGMIGNDGSILSQNNNLKESEFLSSDARTGTARGIRQLIQNRNKQVLEKINALKKKYEEGGFGSLETKDGREKAQEAYNKAASEVRKDSTLSKPVIIIKSTPNASYESLINILDEMQINSIAKYQIDNMTQIDSLMVLDHRGMLKK
ncbi:MAG: biopolymer transporter ExbD, partial [Muribaculaceae bacterium]|nr:biopolymer transporter ExbD [Muribaculaceae bacterium]